ncbi:PucR family transcriptional regulator [Leekyejoonella antrihumi]|nr:PucR family transcriptional regulator [Leekyejoonella antrihumi]
MITIAQLIAHTELSCSLIAGTAGLDNPIRWAHLSELEDPCRWLRGKELLMTTGMALPKDAAPQVAYIRRLAKTGVSGVAIGTGMHAPPLTPELLHASEEFQVPLLEVSGGVPFIAISETVAIANQDALHRRLTMHLRTYEVLGVARQQSMETSEIIRRLEQVAGFRIWAVTRSGASLFNGTDVPSFHISDNLIGEVLDRASPTLRFPKEMHLPQDDGTAYLLPIHVRSSPVGALVTRTIGNQEADLLSMHHLAEILSHLASDLLKVREQARREGGERLAFMLHESEQQRQHTIQELFPASDPREQYSFVVVALDGKAVGWDDLHNHLLEHGFEHCATKRREQGIILIRLGGGMIDTIAKVLVDNLPDSIIGLSSTAVGDADLLVCQRQARWALRSAIATAQPLQQYAADASAPRWMPMESSDLQLIVEDILGPLLTYDSSRGTELVPTLIAFLEENRSWKATAARLFIHRQSLIGRVSRIEKLTGRRLTSTEDVCNLWLAIKAHDILQRSRTTTLDG